MWQFCALSITLGGNHSSLKGNGFQEYELDSQSRHLIAEGRKVLWGFITESLIYLLWQWADVDT